MSRKMCSECPFNPTSLYQQRFGPDGGEKWAAAQYQGIPENYRELEEDLFSSLEFPHGCHMLDDRPFHPDPEKQCIGHLEHLKKERAKKGLPSKPLMMLPSHYE